MYDERNHGMGKLEVQETPEHRATSIVLDGVGSTGKTAMTDAIEAFLAHFLSGQVDFHRTKEPPDWDVPGLPSPYDVVTSGALSPSAVIPYLAAVRRMDFLGAQFDRKPLHDKDLERPLKDVMDDPHALVVSSRSAFSTFYQIAQGGNVWGSDMMQIMYGRDPIFFPDMLFVLVPDDPDAQRQRLAERVEQASGQLSDVQDDPEAQGRYLQACEDMLDRVNHLPGVYKIISGRVYDGGNFPVPMDSGLAISLLSAVCYIERNKEVEFHPVWQGKEVQVERMYTDLPIKVYRFPDIGETYIPRPGYVSGGIQGLEYTFLLLHNAQEKRREGLIFGDVALMLVEREESVKPGFFGGPRVSYDLVLVTTEDPCRVSIESACREAQYGCDKGHFYPLSEFPKRYETDPGRRGWQHIIL